jgi:type IV pilus assembly protein PilY1
MDVGKIRIFIICIIAMFALSFTEISSAQTPPEGEGELLTTSTDPDALILLDLSGSMDWNPADGSNKWGNLSCAGTFYGSSGTGHITDCRKVEIAKRAIFSVLDDNNDNKVDSTDRSSLGVRFGYMRYNGCSASDDEAHIKYSSNAACTSDTVGCAGSGSSYYIYGHDATCLANSSPGNCTGSGSSYYIYGHTSSCAPDSTYCTGTGCSGGFCHTSKTNCSRNCNLDCSGGYCHNSKTGCNTNCGGCSGGFCNASKVGCSVACPDPIYNYSSGCNILITAIDTKYSCIFCSNLTSCSGANSSGNFTGCSTTNACSNGECVSGETASGGTPLAAAVHEAKLYLDAHKAQDTSAACRKKFVILVTDGSDTLGCTADGSECAPDRYKNRRESVAMAKELADAGYQLFVIGFGASMPSYLQNTLNWMAYYGRTDDPNTANAGDTSAYSIASGSRYPTGITSCQTDGAAVTATCYDSGGSHSQANYRASSNDPGYLNLSGYAFMAADADQLAVALKTATNLIKGMTFHFTQASIQSARTNDENFLYEASFEPVSSDPFWYGHLKKFIVNSDASLTLATPGDAADQLQARSASTRTMYTCAGCTSTLTDFKISTTAPINTSYFGSATTAQQRDDIINYVRGEEGTCPGASCTDPDYTAAGVYKLGDLFRSSPIAVGTPSPFFDDIRDQNYQDTSCVYCTGGSCSTSTINTNAFGIHRCNSTRSTDNGKRLIVVGANDGQLHAFKTSDLSEAWSFIPPNLLSRLNTIAHNAHPTGLTHGFFVDGSVTGADVWLGTGDGKSKNAADWKTIVVFGEGRGGYPNLWSSSQDCGTGFSSVYTTGYPYYCGYYALNVDNTLSPTFMWHLGGTSIDQITQGPYLGDPWSKVLIGRVLIDGNERWVGFVGGGYNGTTCTGVTCGVDCDCRGKGFFVIDLKDGTILWKFTVADDANMKYSIPDSPAIVDLDNDGFIDRAYIGDVGGNVWRFNFCTAAMAAQPGGCGTNKWTGGRLFVSSSVQPIYSVPVVAKDGAGRIWVYWGTGNKTDPTYASSQDTFFALIDGNGSYNIGQLKNVTSPTATYDINTDYSTYYGYYINLSTGEKVLADPTLLGGYVYFTTYLPSSDVCNQLGNAYLYAIWYNSGAGGFSAGGDIPSPGQPLVSGGSRSKNIGSGIPSAPAYSIGLTSSGTGSPGDIMCVTVIDRTICWSTTSTSGKAKILYWRDRRIQ